MRPPISSTARRLDGFAALVAAVASGPAPARTLDAERRRMNLRLALDARRRPARGVSPRSVGREFDLGDVALGVLALGLRRERTIVVRRAS